jgi:hypothetical protein
MFLRHLASSSGTLSCLTIHNPLPNAHHHCGYTSINSPNLPRHFHRSHASVRPMTLPSPPRVHAASSCCRPDRRGSQNVEPERVLVRLLWCIGRCSLLLQSNARAVMFSMGLSKAFKGSIVRLLDQARRYSSTSPRFWIDTVEHDLARCITVSTSDVRRHARQQLPIATSKSDPFKGIPASPCSILKHPRLS